MSDRSSQGREIGIVLAQRLGLSLPKREGHDLAGPCIACQSSDAFRLHIESGIAQCYSCQSKWSPLQLAVALLTDRDLAKALLNELGIFKSSTNGHRATSVAPDPIAVIADQKGITSEALRAFGAKIFGPNSIQLPAYGPDGKQCSTFTMNTSGGKGRFAKGKKAGLFFPHVDGKVRLPQPGETWHLVEGPKDAAALHGLGLLACGLNTSRLAAKFARLFAGANIVLVPDRDHAGENGAQNSARALRGVVATMRVAVLPAEFKESGGPDVRDVLKQPGGRELVLQAIADAQPWETIKGAVNPDDDRPEIEVTPDEHKVNDRAVAAIGRDESLYQRGGVLVQIVRDHGPQELTEISRPANAPRIALVKEPTLRERLTAVARFVKRKETDEGEEFQQVHPPAFCIAAVAARGHWPEVRHLEGVISSPILRNNGTVLQTRGYDITTGLCYEPDGPLVNVPTEPTHEDAVVCRDALLELVADFPFASAAHQASWLSFVLTPLARHAFPGPSPLFLIDANIRASGKSLLADLGAIIVTGRDMPRMSCPGEDDEMRKRITAIALGGDQMVLIDNIAGELGSASLDAVLTGTVWKDRILGRSEIVEMSLMTVWAATGNNVILRADTSRRISHIRLESKLENPEEREDFRHPNLLKWVRDERPRLLAAALTILAAYCRAGRPNQGLKPWGSFEGWSSLVRQAIAWVGLPDPGETRQELARSSDREASSLRALLQGWPEVDAEGTGLTATRLIERLEANPDAHELVRSAISELCPTQFGKFPSSKSVGSKLRHLRGRVVGGKALDKRDRHGTAVWFVRDVTQTDANQRQDIADGGCFGGSGCSEASHLPAIPERDGANGNDAQRLGAEPPSQPDQPEPPPGTPTGHQCIPDDWINEPQKGGRLRTTCKVCGRFVGYRPAER
jgi:hypothetical protein